MRVKSNQSKYSEGLSIGEIEDQWTQSMAAAASRTGDPFQARARNPSYEVPGSDDAPSETMENLWSQTMQNTMQTQFDEVMRLVDSRPAINRGFQDLPGSLREAKDSGDDASFMAILTVIRAELS